MNPTKPRQRCAGCSWEGPHEQRHRKEIRFSTGWITALSCPKCGSEDVFDADDVEGWELGAQEQRENQALAVRQRDCDYD